MIWWAQAPLPGPVMIGGKGMTVAKRLEGGVVGSIPLPAGAPGGQRGPQLDETRFKGRDFLSVADYTSAELFFILNHARRLKAEHAAGQSQPLLVGKTLAMIFAKPSTRTRVSFEVGMSQLGGNSLFLNARTDLQLGRGESMADTARVLSRYVNGIMIRTFAHTELLELAHHATVPVINGLTDLLHPCQAMADFMTILEAKGRLEDVVVAYVGDGNNMVHSLMLGAARFGVRLRVATPHGFGPDPAIVEQARACSPLPGTLQIGSDPRAAVAGADVVYTDVWAGMGAEDEATKRRQVFSPYQVNEDLFNLAAQDAVFMHCLPAHRGQEVTDAVIDSPRSVVFDQAENRLHVQKALLALLMG